MREKTGNKFLDDLLDAITGLACFDELAFNDDNDEVDVDIEVDDDIEADDDDLPFSDDDCEKVGCDHCEHFDECYADEIAADEFEMPCWGIPYIDRIVFSGPATIVFWQDGTKTVVKCMKDQPFERYAGFAAACMKKMFGSTSRAKAIMESCVVEQPVTKEKKPHTNKVHVPDLTQAFHEVVANSESVQEAVNETFVRQ